LAKKVLVTGGAGFIGSHTVDLLVKQGHEVRILDNLSTGNLNNISQHLDSGKAELVEGDIRDAEVVKERFNGVDAVVHFAALVSVPMSVQDPDTTFDVNAAGTLNVLRQCEEMHVPRFVFISSCSVCGDPKHNKTKLLGNSRRLRYLNAIHIEPFVLHKSCRITLNLLKHTIIHMGKHCPVIVYHLLFS